MLIRTAKGKSKSFDIHTYKSGQIKPDKLKRISIKPLRTK
jgi:hypothetical protein